jgi:hypothetical protein
MNDDDFQRLSFAATIAYGLLAAFGLILSGLWLGSVGAAVAGLVCAGAAYVSQLLASHAEAAQSHPLLIISYFFQVLSLSAWVYGVWVISTGGA